MTPGPEPLDRRLRLIVITDAALAAPRSIVDVAAEALAAGAPALQLRSKDSSATDLYRTADALLGLTRAAGALLFVNDRADVALAVGADGVHVGPNDVPVAALRSAVPPGFLIGTSTDDPTEARRLAAAGADYIGCGAVYPTSTKADAGDVIGVEGLARVVASVAIPVVGIGGVSVERVGEVAATGAAGAAVVGAVMSASEVDRAVRALLAPWGGSRL